VYMMSISCPLLSSISLSSFTTIPPSCGERTLAFYACSHKHTYKHTRIHTHISMYAPMHTLTHTLTHTHTHTHTVSGTGTNFVRERAKLMTGSFTLKAGCRDQHPWPLHLGIGSNKKLCVCVCACVWSCG